MASSTSPQNKTRSPVANPVPSFWTSTPGELDNHRSTPELPSTSDVVIIGGGFAGVATAYHILQDNPSPPSIMLLEARTVCGGATGRNGGHVKPDTYFNVPKYASLHGAAAAAELAAFEAANVYAVKALVEREGLDCDFHLTRAVDVYLDPAHARDTEAAYRELVRGGVVDMRDVAFTPRRDAERVSGVKGAQCCFSFTAAHLYPLKMAQQLLRKMIDKHGLNVQAHTPVESVVSRDDGRWSIQTARGTITARKVVYATNGYTASVLPEYAGRIVPVRGVCSRISSPQKGVDTPHLVNTYGIRFDARNNDYLIPRADGSIVVGGARQKFWHVKDSWFDNVRDDEVVKDAAPYFDGYMQRHFRGWEDSGAKTDLVWTGIMGYSSDFKPHLGQVPDKAGQYIIAGFSGHGMPEILLSSKGVAAMVRDDVPFEKSGLPSIFKTTKERITNKQSPLEESLKPLWEDDVKARL